MIHIKSFEEIPTRGVALLDLQNHHCRFPLKDEPGFCGAVRLEHSSYCGPCHARAYRGASGSRSTVAGRVLDMACEAVAPAREGRAQQIVTEATALHDMGVQLDKFVRAAAARRSEPPVSIVVRSVPVKTPYVAPRLSESEFGVIERWYLHSLSRQCDDMVGDFRSLAVRGRGYAIRMRDWITYQLDITINELTCNRRTKDLVASRHFVMFCLCKGATELSLPYLGRELFGGFDHTSLIHGRDKIAREIAAGTLASRLDSLLGRICEFDNEIASAVRKLRVKVDASAPT